VGVVSSPAKRKGTRAETELVLWLRENGWPDAERRALNGSRDRGDIAGVCSVAIEVKNRKEFAPAEWVDEAKAEAVNAGVNYHLVVAKRRMKPIEQGYAIQEVGQAFRIARRLLELERIVALHGLEPAS
jgi:hypothetical protein